MKITARLAEFVAETPADAIPTVVRERALLTVVDAYATAVAGAGEAASRVIRRALIPMAGRGRGRVVGEPELRVDPASAAAMNGASAHCLDYDTISLEVSGFVAGQMACALTALVEDGHPETAGRDVLTAFCLGWEVAAAIGRGVNTLHYAKGWHPTATLGLLAATAAACRLEGFDPAQTATALGIAVSEASGVKTMVGNMLNPWHTGKSARNAVVATRLTRAGFAGHPGALEAEQGFLNLFNGPGAWDAERIIHGLGERWDLEQPGPVFKVYPCCGLIHSGLDAVLALRAEHRLAPEDVRAVVVRVHEFVPRVMHIDVPLDGYAAKFSIPYCVAAALLSGEIGLGTFRDVHPSVVEYGRRVRTEVHPDLHGGETFLEREFTEVILETAGGPLLRRVNRLHNRGTGDNFVLADLRAKFGDCLEYASIASAAGGEWERLLALDADRPWDLWPKGSSEPSRHAS